jgi:hypothetical protein
MGEWAAMEAIGTLSEILRAGGGWGLAAVLCIVIWRLLVYIRELHRERIREQKAAIQLLEGVKSSLAGNEKALDRFTEKLDRLITERRA